MRGKKAKAVRSLKLRFERKLDTETMGRIFTTPTDQLHKWSRSDLEQAFGIVRAGYINLQRAKDGEEPESGVPAGVSAGVSAT